MLFCGAVVTAASPFDDAAMPGDEGLDFDAEEQQDETEDLESEDETADRENDDDEENESQEDDEDANDEEEAEETEDVDEDRTVRGYVKENRGSRAAALKAKIAAARARLAQLNDKITRFSSKKAAAGGKKFGKKFANKFARKFARKLIRGGRRGASRHNNNNRRRRHHSPRRGSHQRSIAAWRRAVRRAHRYRTGKAALFHKYHKKLLNKMWKAVRHSRQAKNKKRYFALLKMFRQLKGAWARRRALMSQKLRQRLANKVRAREARRSRREQLRAVSRRYRKTTGALRGKYEQSYLRYLKLIARFFRRKYKVLVVEYLREHRQNVGLKKAMWDLRAKLHTALEARDLMAKLKAKREALARWIKRANDLKLRLADVEAKLAALRGAHKTLKKLHADTHKSLQDANGNIAQLKAQIAALQSQLANTKASLAACQDTLSKTVAAAKAAAAAAEKKYNDLSDEYKAALAKHGALSKELTDKNTALANQLAECKRNVCIPDVCGKCGGDESSCQRRTAPETCHAVGDPHYRSYNDFNFNYQITGEFSLSRHLQDFEVQNLQEPCPNPAVRCNKAFAVRAGSHVIVVYAAWGPGTILVDGVRTRTTLEQRVQLDTLTSYTAHANMVEVRYKDFEAKGIINPWDNTQYMDLYVTVPGRVSNGRSVTGLCGNFGGSVADDQANVNNGQQHWVANTDRSLFRNPKPRTMMDLDLEDEMHQSQLEAQSEKIAQAMREAGSVTGNPHLNNVLAFKDADQQKLIDEECSKGVHGNDKKDCEFDLLAGASADGTRHADQMAQLLDHEKLLDIGCVTADKPGAATYAAHRLAADEHDEGFTLAFWYKPSEAPAGVAQQSIVSRGTTFVINTQGSALAVRHGVMECISPNVIAKDSAIQITAAVSHKGSLVTYINGQKTCEAHEDDPPKAEFGDEPLAIVDPSGAVPPAKGTVSRLFYLPLTIEARDITRYSDRKEPGCLAAAE